MVSVAEQPALSIRPPDPFTPGQHPAEAWRLWRKLYIIFAEAADLGGKQPKQKRAILLHSLGPEGQRIIEHLEVGDAADLKSPEAILAAIDADYAPYDNQTFARFQFFSCKHRPQQSIDHYVLA